MNVKETEKSVVELIFLSLFAIVEYSIGVILHLKIIKASEKEKEVTWKLDVTNSLVLMANFLNIVTVYLLFYNVDNFYTYTGEWFCYTSKVVIYYGVLYVTGHSLVVSIMKYLIIVRWKEVLTFGREKVLHIFFWINLLHPAFTILLHLIIRPDFFWAYDGFAQIDRCLGEDNQDPMKNDSRHKVLTFDFCDDFIQPDSGNYFWYLINLARTTVCGLQIVLEYLVTGNFFEILFYCLIFQFLKRYGINKFLYVISG